MSARVPNMSARVPNMSARVPRHRRSQSVPNAPSTAYREAVSSTRGEETARILTVTLARHDTWHGLSLNSFGRVVAIEKSSAAEMAGIQPYDRVVAIDGRAPTTYFGLDEALEWSNQVTLGLERPPRELHACIAAKECDPHATSPFQLRALRAALATLSPDPAASPAALEGTEVDQDAAATGLEEGVQGAPSPAPEAATAESQLPPNNGRGSAPRARRHLRHASAPACQLAAISWLLRSQTGQAHGSAGSTLLAASQRMPTTTRTPLSPIMASPRDELNRGQSGRSRPRTPTSRSKIGNLSFLVPRRRASEDTAGTADQPCPRIELPAFGE